MLKDEELEKFCHALHGDKVYENESFEKFVQDMSDEHREDFKKVIYKKKVRRKPSVRTEQL